MVMLFGGFVFSFIGLPLDLFYIWATSTSGPEEFASKRINQVVIFGAPTLYGALLAIGELALIIGGLISGNLLGVVFIGQFALIPPLIF